MNLKDVKFDCKHFKGHIPCKPNKERNKTCDNCDEYSVADKKILFIKLGAIGDVIRTTPLIVKYKKLYPNCHISWITLTPDILPKNEIDEIYKFTFKSVYIIKNKKFDIAINLDKDFEACALLKDVNAEKKYGFILKDNHIDIATKNAKHKFLTGINDIHSQKNKKNYLEEIFEICHFEFKGEPYLINFNKEFSDKWKKKLKEKANGKKIVALNTGCGKRWLTRLWPADYYIKLIKMLQNGGYFPLILGGPDEHEQNLIYEQETGAYYPGTFSLTEFIAITNNVDLVLTVVSMMMHIAIALKKQMVLFVNIFNINEFFLYERGEIIKPPTGCDCYFGNKCKRGEQKHCMKDITVDEVYETIVRNIK